MQLLLVPTALILGYLFWYVSWKNFLGWIIFFWFRGIASCIYFNHQKDAVTSLSWFCTCVWHGDRIGVFDTTVIFNQFNNRMLGRDATYRWEPLNFFTCFHTSVYKIIFKIINMTIEPVVFLFLLPRSDICNPCVLKSEANENTYGGLRWARREFNMTQVTGVEDKRRNYINAVRQVGVKNPLRRLWVNM